MRLSFYLCLGISAALIIAGFFVPPIGVIDGSVFTGVGFLFGFAALGMYPEMQKNARNIRFTIGKMVIEITHYRPSPRKAQTDNKEKPAQ